MHAQVDRLGGTIYRLRDFKAAIEAAPLVPKSLLNAQRRELVAQLDAAATIPKSRAIAEDRVLPILRFALGRTRSSLKRTTFGAIGDVVPDVGTSRGDGPRGRSNRLD